MFLINKKQRIHSMCSKVQYQPYQLHDTHQFLFICSKTSHLNRYPAQKKSHLPPITSLHLSNNFFPPDILPPNNSMHQPPPYQLLKQFGRNRQHRNLPAVRILYRHKPQPRNPQEIQPPAIHQRQPDHTPHFKFIALVSGER